MWEQGAQVQRVLFISPHFFYLILFILLCPDSIEYSSKILQKCGQNCINKAQEGELGKYSSGNVGEGIRWRNQRSALQKAS